MIKLYRDGSHWVIEINGKQRRGSLKQCLAVYDHYVGGGR